MLRSWLMEDGGTRRLDPERVDTWRDHGRLVSADGVEISVTEKRVIVGRAPGCDLVLGDARVSATHLEFWSSQHGVHVRDLDTTNGTYLGPVRIHEAVLADGTTLALGGPEGPTIAFRYDDIPKRVETPPDAARFERLVGGSLPMRALYADLAQLAPTDINLLIEGETGTGKEEVARSIHAASNRADGPFIVVDCGALAPALLESLLFGHEKGAFSGASERKIGLAEAADGGTLFLDELGELPPEAQTRLLRLLEARTVRRVGSTTEKRIDIRVVSATHRDIPQMISGGTFRSDLFFRLAAARLVVPPLRDRRDDIPLLVDTLLERLDFTPRPVVTQDALDALCRREYVGNVRELRNVLEVARALSGGAIDAKSVQRRSAYERISAAPAVGAPKPVRTAPEHDALWSGHLGLFREEKVLVVDRFERAYLERLHKEHAGNLTHAAAAAGIERHHLRKLLRKHGIIAPAKKRTKAE